MKKLVFWHLGLALLTIFCTCIFNYGHALQDKIILKGYANLKRYRRENGYTTLAPVRRTGGTARYKPHSEKLLEILNMTGLSEVEIAKRMGNKRNHTKLDSKGFPELVNYTRRPTMFPEHHLLHKHTIWKPFSEFNANSNETHEILSSLKEAGNKEKKEPERKKKETASQLEKETTTSKWKPRPLEIIVGAICGFLVVSLMIFLLYQRRMKKLKKIEVTGTVSHSCAQLASTNEGFKEIEEI